jgi:N-ATPase, AtpR subunit
MTAPAMVIAALFAIAGFAFGRAYFAALRRTADLLAGSATRLLPAAWTLARLAAAIVFLGGAAKIGALPLLTALAGFLAARGLALRAARREA